MMVRVYASFANILDKVVYFPIQTLQRESNYLKDKSYYPNCFVGVTDSTPWIRTEEFYFLKTILTNAPTVT